MSDEDALLALTRDVAAAAESQSLPTALIGALALATHGYVRATSDADLATCTAFSPNLRDLRDRLHTLGLDASLQSPDDDDPLNGVIRVRRGDALVEVVNLRGRLGRVSVERAEEIDESLRCVRAAELVALKLYAGGRGSINDVHELLDANPALDLDEVGATCEEVGLGAEWARILATRA